MISRPWNSTDKIIAGFGNVHLNQAALQNLYPTHKLFRLKQTHSNIVWSADQDPTDPFPIGDALITDRSDLLLAVITADCLPVLAWGKNFVGACHAGWRGLQNKILPKFVNALITAGERSQDIRISIGPSIGPCHFEVGLDVSKLLQDVAPGAACILDHPNPEKRFVDLRMIAQTQLSCLGIIDLEMNGQCTYCELLSFASYRRDGSTSKRQVSFIAKC